MANKRQCLFSWHARSRHQHRHSWFAWFSLECVWHVLLQDIIRECLSCQRKNNNNNNEGDKNCQMTWRDNKLGRRKPLLVTEGVFSSRTVVRTSIQRIKGEKSGKNVKDSWRLRLVLWVLSLSEEFCQENNEGRISSLNSSYLVSSKKRGKSNHRQNWVFKRKVREEEIQFLTSRQFVSLFSHFWSILSSSRGLHATHSLLSRDFFNQEEQGIEGETRTQRIDKGSLEVWEEDAGKWERIVGNLSSSCLVLWRTSLIQIVRHTIQRRCQKTSISTLLSHFFYWYISTSFLFTCSSP